MAGRAAGVGGIEKAEALIATGPASLASLRTNVKPWLAAVQPAEAG